MLKIAIVGGRDLGVNFFGFSLPANLISALLAIIATLPEGAEVGVRGPVQDATSATTMRETMFTSRVEELAFGLANGSGRKGRIYRPDSAIGGKSSVYVRDFNLVEYAEKVYAFFTAENVMNGGTGHVVKAAIDRGVPVEAWYADEDGNLGYVGEEAGPGRPLSPSELEDLYMRTVGSL
jgi:hypothetical protein